MKNLFFKLILLFAIYYLIQYAYSFFSQGYEKEYLIIKEQTIKINEKYTANKKKEHDNYFIKIKIENDEFALQTYYNFEKKQKIVKDVHYYKDQNYVCIYPEFIVDAQLFDIICKNGDSYINYSAIANPSQSLKDFAKNIPEYIEFIDEKSDYEKQNLSTIYTKNLVKNHYISLSNYTGVDLITKDNIKDANIFEEDVYKRQLSAYVGRKYIIANYEKNLYFESFNVVDIITGEIKTLSYSKNINFNSYIMGVVGESVYLLDKTTKTQYEIDPFTREITIIGNADTGARFYNNGKWENVDINTLVKTEKKFIYNETKDNTTIIKKGNKLSGYNYYFVSNGNKCDVYRSNVQDDSKKTYLFTTKKCDSQKLFLDDYIYFVDDDLLKYYSDSTGVKTLIMNNELLHNDTILIGGTVKSAK